MSFLKHIPITYKGELHDIVLVNFSTAVEEVAHLLPEGLQVREINGRAMISMVNVKLRNMRPAFMEKVLKFNYQHIGFRLLVQEKGQPVDSDRYIFFLKSFTNKPLMAWGGSLLTDYRLTVAELFNHKLNLDFRHKQQVLSYTLDLEQPIDQPHAHLKETIGKMDSALAVNGKGVYCTRIMREKWPLEEVHCTDFKTNFFETAQLEGVFRVPEVIHYTWLPPKPARAYANEPMNTNQEIIWQ